MTIEKSLCYSSLQSFGETRCFRNGIEEPERDKNDLRIKINNINSYNAKNNSKPEIMMIYRHLKNITL